MALYRFSCQRRPATAQPRPVPATTAGRDEPATSLGSDPRSQRLARWITPVIVALTVVVAAAAVFKATAQPVALRSGKPASTATRAVSVSEEPAATVIFQGVPGQLTVTTASDGRVHLTGRLTWAGSAPTDVTRFDRSASVLELSYRCSAGSPCTESYQLTVPANTAVTLNQPSGQIVLTGLAGPLRITTGHAAITATGLRSPDLTASVRSGSLDVSFDIPPRNVGITLRSAQATLRLPGSATYLVRQRITSGSADITIPQARNAARIVTLDISSGEAKLLTATGS
jgi:hypothetical protein